MHVAPKRILWPTDFSDLSLCGGHYARAFAEQFGAEIHVLHVVAPPLSPDVSVMIPAEVPVSYSQPELIESSRSAMEKLIAQHFAGIEPVQREVAFGDAAQCICRYAEEHEIDLIVVTTHGRTGLGHVLICSTAERIVQHAPCPVLTVKSRQRGFVQPPPPE